MNSLFGRIAVTTIVHDLQDGEGQKRCFSCSLDSHFYFLVCDIFVVYKRPDSIFQVLVPDLKHILIASSHF